MKVFGLIVNLMFPGIGSLFFRKYVQAIFQFIIWAIGFILTITGILAIIGVPIILIAWGWALATSITTLSAPDKREKYGYRLDAADQQQTELPTGSSSVSQEKFSRKEVE